MSKISRTKRIWTISVIILLVFVILVALGSIQLPEEVVEIVEPVIAAFTRIWNTRLMSIGDGFVTPGQIVIAMFILSIGLVLVRRLAAEAKKRLLSRFALDVNAMMLIERTVYYALVAIVILLALDIVNIPLTIFTFLGGAVAIALGFGGQALLGNFISGFILMIEKPIKIGDLIEFQGTYGKVTEIGARCTTLRTPDNLSILVPNSQLIENALTNWTLSDFMVRTSVTVGVAYGSPTRQVADLIMKAVTEHDSVQKRPEPVVLFTDFGDNSLGFRVHFWVHMKNFMDRLKVESDVRFRIDDLFREAGITISFPQRDVHLDTLKPLDIRLLKDAPQEK
ncbi:mechanosensitive ion channel [bacterium]|nr:mechanosensitive ion channel [bacterium]